MAQEPRKSELIAQLALARQEISTNYRGLRRDVDVPRRLQTSFRKNGVAWLGGASVLGFLVARLARKKKVVAPRRLWSPKPDAEEKVVKAGLLITVLKIAFDIARPFLTKWVARTVRAYAEQRFAARH